MRARTVAATIAVGCVLLAGCDPNGIGTSDDEPATESEGPADEGVDNDSTDSMDEDDFGCR